MTQAHGSNVGRMERLLEKTREPAVFRPVADAWRELGLPE